MTLEVSIDLSFMPIFTSFFFFIHVFLFILISAFHISGLDKLVPCMNDQSIQKMFFEDLLFTGLQFLGNLERTGTLPCQYEHYNKLSSYYFLLGLYIYYKCTFYEI